MNATPTRAQLLDWISAWMSQEMRVAGGQVAPERTFVSYGMDSIHAMMLVGDLEEHLRRRFPPTLAWDHPTPAALASHLAPESVVDAAAPDDLLAQIDVLSEDVIDRLLEARLRDAPVS